MTRVFEKLNENAHWRKVETPVKEKFEKLNENAHLRKVETTPWLGRLRNPMKMHIGKRTKHHLGKGF